MNKSKIQKFAVDGHKLLYKQIAKELISTALKKETSARRMLPKFAVAFSPRLRRASERH